MSKQGNETIGERIRELRKRRGWRQTELASQLHCSEFTINRIENNKRELMVSEVKAICEVFNVTADYLIRGEGISADNSISLQGLSDANADLVRQLVKSLETCR